MNHNAAAASRVIADELQRAERSILTATRDAAQLLVTSLDATSALGLSPAFSLGAAAAAVSSIQSLLESQQHMVRRAHPAFEKIGKSLGLTVVDWGESYPKPSSASEHEPDRSLAVHAASIA